MISTLRHKILRFLNSGNETPLLAGIAAGLYPILFYYGNNYGMANSVIHLLFFTGFFIVLPTLLLLGVRKMLAFGRLRELREYVLPAFSVAVFLFLIMICLYAGISKKMLLGIFIITDLFVLTARKHYKKIIVLQLLMAIVGFVQLLPDMYAHISSNDDWAHLSPEAQRISFTKTPNIYMIQPDGYAGFSELKKGYYNYDNSAFETWLTDQGFSLYPDFRSNYYSTLSSNSSLFAMKHHYYKNTVSERRDIAGKNNVLSMLKANGYTTHLLLEKEYVIANKPKLYFDSCNISNSEVPFVSTALRLQKDVKKALNIALKEKDTTPKFFFVEQLMPKHIHVYKKNTMGVAAERQAYLDRLETTNTWLKDIIGTIRNADPEALIIILADHGGFVGFQYTLESHIKTQDRDKIYGIFGSALAVKWPEDYDRTLDKDLVSSVNFFRVLFSHLSDSRTLLQHKEADISYIPLQKGTQPGVYAYIAEDGSIQCEKRE